MRQIFRALRRYFTILGVFIDYGFRILANRFVKSIPALIPPQELREVLEKLGGSFLKFGQLAAVRPDYFPEEYCQELLRLLDARAKKITDEMKIRAAEALAGLVKKPRENNVVPGMFDKRVMRAVSRAIRRSIR